MQDATKAMQQLNGLEIGGSAIRVQIASVAAGDSGAITYGELDEDDGKPSSISSPKHHFIHVSLPCLQERTFDISKDHRNVFRNLVCFEGYLRSFC